MACLKTYEYTGVTFCGCRRHAWSSPLSSPEHRSQSEVARAYGVSQGGITRLVARYRIVSRISPQTEFTYRP